MSRTIEKACDLRTALAGGDPLFVLFYAAWCPFSRQFLPVYEKHSEGRETDFVRIALDGYHGLAKLQQLQGDAIAQLAQPADNDVIRVSRSQGNLPILSARRFVE